MTAAAASSVAPGERVTRWTVLLALLVGMALLPQFIVLPTPPADAIRIERAQFDLEGAAPRTTLALPHSWSPSSPYEVATGTYRLTFEGEDAPREPLLIFIPAARHGLEAWVNGERAMSALDTAWGSPASGYSFLARIPDGAIRPGPNEIVLRQTREAGWLPGGISPVYIGSDSAIMPSYRLSNLLIEQIRSVTLALHIALAIGIVTIWSVRRHDPVFRWLALVATASLFVVLTQSPLAAPLGMFAQFQSIVAVSAVGLMALGLALTLSGIARPPWLIAAIVFIPLLLLGLAQLGALAFPLVGFLSAAIALLAYIAAATVLAVNFVERRNFDAAIMAIPCALTAWFGLHDILVIGGLLNDPFLLVSNLRTAMLLAIMFLLMMRLARSLNGLDTANETLRTRLVAQEAELNRLHEKDRARAGELAREQERHRLTQDLHDGLSGHLVSIIALAEKPATSTLAIERSAREALEDLRLVIQSLDLGDHDLLAALAGFRERLIPQLRRLHVTLDWSTEAMPQIGGITPGNALTILRILQEAVTNALKHGPATRISIIAAPAPDGASIVIANDCHMWEPSQPGRGLANMQRRAARLGARVDFERDGGTARVTLLLPRVLAAPDARLP